MVLCAKFPISLTLLQPHSGNDEFLTYCTCNHIALLVSGSLKLSVRDTDGLLYFTFVAVGAENGAFDKSGFHRLHPGLIH